MERWKEDVIIGLRNRQSIETCARMLAGKTVAELYEAKELDPEFSAAWDNVAPLESDDTSAPDPRVLTPQALEALMWSQCSDEEAAAYFSLEVGEFKGRVAASDALTRAYKLGPMGGKAALKRAQFEKAMSGDSTMQTWVGKQALGQSDKVDTTVTHKEEIDAEGIAKRMLYLLEQGGVEPPVIEGELVMEPIEDLREDKDGS